jgi:ATP-dependent RNA helicase DbpA
VQTQFSVLPLSEALVQNLSSMGYDQMTPIQANSLPPILAKKDVIAQAKTGSGKTAAFGLGILHHLNVKRFRVQSLVLCPTRELADQVAKEIRKLARAVHNIKVLTLCGGMPFGPQIGSLEHGAHIVVGTPGRIEEHIRKGYLKLDDVNCFVLDEADRMLEMGFEPVLETITEQLPQQRQTLLFSATFPSEIEAMSKHLMRNPLRVEGDISHTENKIKQLFYKEIGSRQETVKHIILTHQPKSAVVFCHTKIDTQELADYLNDEGFSVLALHGDLEQRQRDQVLVRFANKSCTILTATDVASRGLDIDSIDMVINCHISRDPEIHVHRIGRTGRADKSGLACSVYSEKDKYKVELIEGYTSIKAEYAELNPSFASKQPIPRAQMATLQIDGGKKSKVRPGDILGALTSDKSIDGKLVGKIAIFDNSAYVAVDQSVLKLALNKLSKGKLKGRSFRCRHIRD